MTDSPRSFPFLALASPLAADERAALRDALARLLTWQRTLEKWPERLLAPAATPIVSLYRHGELAGCAGLDEGSPGERLQRAFLAALGDVRFGGVDRSCREELVAQVSYVVAPRRIAIGDAARNLEIGNEGALLIGGDGRPAMLLPDVARDHHLGPEEFLEALAVKADTPRRAWSEGALWAFTTERVIARQAAQATAPSDDACAAAARWLAERVDRGGVVAFGFEPRDGSSAALGPLWHGRAAVAVRALDGQPDGRAAAARARRWLAREIGDALAGRAVSGWPDSLAMVAGTVALATLAGLELERDLEALARNPELQQNPWHAAQVVTALGSRAPEALFRACATDLEQNPWAPWTALAAHRRGAAEVFARAVTALRDGVRASGPHVGGVGPGAVPEIARTAATVEALRLADDDDSRAATRRARAFLLRHQLRAENYPRSTEPLWCDGAFPLTPVLDYLQTDVTAHALLALADDATF